MYVTVFFSLLFVKYHLITTNENTAKDITDTTVKINVRSLKISFFSAFNTVNLLISKNKPYENIIAIMSMIIL
ncbi:hypothetical protein SAMN04488097_3520 [Epilithonimonas lactis]|nr:hypothetical protein SAMN04488097_3520 [Epilithonimonas lactis]